MKSLIANNKFTFAFASSAFFYAMYFCYTI